MPAYCPKVVPSPKGHPCRLHLLLVLVALLLLGATPLDAATRVVKVGIYEAKPLAFTDQHNEPQGIYVDLLRYVAEQEGWKLQWVHGSWPNCLRRIQRGDIDLLVAIAYTSQRAKRFRFNREVVLVEWGQIYLPKESKIKSVLDLEGKKVAALQGDIFFEGIKQLTKRFGVRCRFIETFSLEDVLGILETGKVQAGVVNRLFGLQYERKYQVEKSPIVFNPLEARLAGSPRKNSQELLNAIDYYLRRLKSDRQSIYYQSLDYWLGQGGKKFQIFEAPSWLWWGLLVALGLVITFVTVNLVLRREVTRRTAELTSRNQDLIQEIKERRAAEEALRQSERRYRALLDMSPDVIVVHRDWRIIYVNPAGVKLLGATSADELQGRNLLSFYFEEQHERVLQRMAQLRALDENELLPRLEYRLRRLDGKVIYVEATGRMIRYGDQEAVLSVYRDITERKQAEEDHIMKERLQAAIETAGAACHELNQPLQAVLSQAELVLMRMGLHDPNRPNLEMLLDQANRLARITRRLNAITDYRTRTYLGDTKILDLRDDDKK